MRENVEPHARLIASLAETMSDGMWADDLIARCRQIVEEAEKIERIARKRVAGER